MDPRTKIVEGILDEMNTAVGHDADLSDLPKTKAIVERLQTKGRTYYNAVRLYLMLKEQIQSEKDETERTRKTNEAAKAMATLSVFAKLSAQEIVTDGEELARVGIEELSAQRSGGEDATVH